MFAPENSLVQKEPEKNIQVHKFVQFELGQGDLALLPAEKVIEIRVVKADEILPVPELPSCVLGIYQWRGEILWLVDLGYLIGFSSLSWQGTNSMMVLNVEEKNLGMAVPAVTGIESYDFEQFHLASTDLFSQELLPFLQGFFMTQEQKVIRLINTEVIVNFF